MIITCLGHAKFLLELENGMRLVTDPFDASTGYPVVPVRADAVLVSHQHHDHNALDTVQGYTRVLDTPGTHTLSTDVSVEAIEAFHDGEQGRLRGKTLLSVISAEGLRVAHLGDLGHLPDEKQAALLRDVDVLMVPVGGHYTIGPAQAKAVCDMLNPRVILPMHYCTAYNASWPIAPVEDFTKLLGGEVEELDMLRITSGDMKCQPRAAVLRAAVGA